VDVYTPSDIPTIFEYQTQVAEAWSHEEFKGFSENVLEEHMDDCAMRYLDMLVKRDIENGKRGCEWIAINPMWRSSWKKFWRSIIKRHARPPPETPSEQEESADAQAQQEERTEPIQPVCDDS